MTEIGLLTEILLGDRLPKEMRGIVAERIREIEEDGPAQKPPPFKIFRSTDGFYTIDGVYFPRGQTQIKRRRHFLYRFWSSIWNGGKIKA